MRFKAIFVLVFVIFSSCDKDDNPEDGIDYKQEMRDFVIGISQYSKSLKQDFIVIPQNGIELVTDNGEETGQPDIAYLNAIDAVGQEDLFFGYNNDDKETPADVTAYINAFLDIPVNHGKTILVSDYCYTPSKITNSYSENIKLYYISFAADHRELDNVPVFPNPINNENSEVVTRISQVKNFLYLINPVQFTSKEDFISAVISTNYDLLIMDLFFNDGTDFTSDEVDRLKNKANGGKRLVICYMSIGEAEDYRYYWQSKWTNGNPDWLSSENPHWDGNYKVKYWKGEWQAIIYGNDISYLKKIINSNFNGVYLDIIDAFEYFER